MTDVAAARLRFGVQLAPIAAELGRVVELAVQADEEGLDLVGMQDHPYVPDLADTMAVVATVLAVTRRVHVFPDVANLPLRPAPMLARAAATLDVVSGGRFELGLGSGASLRAAAALGVTPVAPAEALARLEVAVHALRHAWRTDRGLAPAHPIEIWLGMVGARGLALTGRLGDGWAAPIPAYLPYERWAWARSVIDDAARGAGRDPRSVRRIAQIVGTVADRRELAFEGVGRGPVRDTVDGWIDLARRLHERSGFDAVVFWPERATSEQITRFATVAAAARAGAGASVIEEPRHERKEGAGPPTAR